MTRDNIGVPQLRTALPASPVSGSAEDALKQISAAAMAGSPTAGSMVALLKQLYTDAMAAGGTAGSLYETLRKLTAVAVPAMDDASVIYNSLFYRLMEIEKHLHSAQQSFGGNAATGSSTNLQAQSVDALRITGGADAFGSEIQLCDGTVIESGSATKKWDLNRLGVIAVGTANRPTNVEFFCGTRAAGVGAVFSNSGGDILVTGATLTDGNKVMVSALTAMPGNISAIGVYYVVSAAGNTCKLSLTSGGAAIAYSSAGTLPFTHLLTQTKCFDTVISAAATNSDATPYPTQMGRGLCSDRIWARAKSKTGTCDIDFFIELHTYPA